MYVYVYIIRLRIPVISMMHIQVDIHTYIIML